ncbi:hypothetical protein ACWGH8_18645 [Nonomuraea muscovyensis]|uniref:Uncharacterized protein n=1 Tax=Nonomuraea muscovyensis TaxID=1124761 RepID=A0A7X0CAM9_9ACTN|nr:hypothetical protein [Nonomuraea muscovyensis]MBB6351655.1 hypothetical protein [Nonomuraea muscovyensis]
MARLVRGLDDEVYVQFGELAVFFEGNEGDILLETAHEDDLALIRLEAWDSAPPAPGDPWTPVEDTTVEGGTGWSPWAQSPRSHTAPAGRPSAWTARWSAATP